MLNYGADSGDLTSMTKGEIKQWLKQCLGEGHEENIEKLYGKFILWSCTSTRRGIYTPFLKTLAMSLSGQLPYELELSRAQNPRRISWY